MITTVIRGEDYDAPERFDAWCELVRELQCEHRIRTDHSTDFPFVLRTAQLGATAVAHTSIPSLHISRTPRMIRQSDSETYQLVLATGGPTASEQCGRQFTANARHWTLYDSSRPHSLWTLEGGHGRPAQAAFALNIPKSLPGLNAARLAPLLTRPLPGDTGIGGMLTDLLTRLLREPAAFGPADVPCVGGVVADLVTTLLAHEAESEHLLPDPAHQQALGLRVQGFVLAHLGDPTLSPGTIAAAHHISVSYLHRIFRRSGQTVAGWIREQRLEHARRDLTDPRQRDTPVHVVAARWGFRHAADFSRAFRRAYGMPPRDYREYATGCQGLSTLSQGLPGAGGRSLT
ncbi:AraC family transcriptional regulator [Streptomyces sp. 4N509B]|uniref:AraC family transcriptional regulator n=1 Tax=Streptomyces sp. 4N509B TaxID=3457413 RepID=UPI003FCFF820